MICANCHRGFKHFYAQLLIWCKKEEMYVCGRCWEDHCKEGHGEGIKNKGLHPARIAVFVLLFLGMILPFAFPFTIDIYLRTGWEDLDTKPLIEIEDGEIVRIEGIINESSNTVAIGGEEHKVKNGYNWEWNDKNEFRFSDDTGTVNVTTEEYYAMEEGLHLAPNRENTRGKVYKGGDEVIIIGKVNENENNTTIYLYWIGTDEEDIKPSLLIYVGAILIIGSSVLICSYILKFSMERNSQHKQKIGYIQAKQIHSYEMEKDTNLNWKKNSNLSLNKMIIIVFSIMLIGIILLPVIYYSLNPHSFDDYLEFSFVCMFVIPLLIALPLGVLNDGTMLKPNDISVSEKGIHFYYNDPVSRFLKDDFIAWGEIENIGYHRTGKSGYWAIDKKNNTFENINGVNKKNKNIIMSSWNKQKRERDDNKQRF